MKRILFSIILIFLCLNINAQRAEAWKVIGVYTASIVLDAVGDGLNDSGEKVLGHSLQAASTGLLLSSPFIIDYQKDKWYWYLLSYTFIRVSLFDYTYNITRGLPLEYRGNSSLFDRSINAFNPPDTKFFRTTTIIVGISIPLNELWSE